MKIKNIYKITATLLLLTTICYSQTSKPVKPLKGTIAFEKSETIIDSKAYDLSITKMLQSAEKAAIKENKAAGIDEDYSGINFTENMKPLLVPAENSLIHFKYTDSVIVAYKSLDKKVIGDYTLINIKKSTTTELAKKDSVTRFLQNRPYEYSDNKILKIQEFKNQTKDIQGYKCFKVIVLEKAISDDPEYNEFTKNDTLYKELWVTDKVKSLYHPVIREKQILEKYYPLDITEYSESLKGYVINYKLQVINLQ